MADRAFSTLVQEVNASVPGCPQPVILRELRKAAIRTCERTLFWRYVQPTDHLTCLPVHTSMRITNQLTLMCMQSLKQ